MYIVAKESNEKNKGGKKQVIKFVKKFTGKNFDEKKQFERYTFKYTYVNKQKVIQQEK